MKSGIASLLLMAALTAPSFAAEPGLEITPLPSRLPSEPSLSFDGERYDPQQNFSDWFLDNVSHAGYRVGMAKLPGMTGQEVAAIVAGPGARDRGGIIRGATSIMAWRGKRVRLSARLKAENVARLQMWLRVIGPEQNQMRRYNMADRPIRGTQDWRRTEIVMDVPGDARFLSFGFYIEGGKGKAFGDDFKLETVGPEVAATPLTGLDRNGWQKLEVGTPASRAALVAARTAAARRDNRFIGWDRIDSSSQNGQLGHYEMEQQLEKARTPPPPSQ